MLRSRLVLVLLLFPLIASAQTADLEVSMDAPPETRPGETYTFSASVVNNGPDPAAAVRLWMNALFPGQCYENELLGTLAVGERRQFSCATDIPTTGLPGYSIYSSVSVSSETSDPNNGNNWASYVARIITPADLRAWLYPPYPLVPGLPATMPVYYVNVAHTAAAQATLTVRGDVAFTAAVAGCSITPGTVTCDLGRLEPSQQGPSYFRMSFVAPDAGAREIDFTVTIVGSEPDPAPQDNQYRAPSSTFRTFFVTNTSDSGDGSLRTALTNAGAQCADGWPCLVAFRIPPGNGAWQTIRPLTPLPAVTGLRVTVDGSLQAAYFADTNPAGPEIELSGSALQEGYGLQLFADCGAAVRGLAINGFPYDGLLVGQSQECPLNELRGLRLVEDNFIGVDPTGTRAEPNSRGIHLTSGPWTVQRNVVSGNRRAGIVVDAGTSFITRNTIGLNRDLTAGLGNGASGVYVAAAASGTDVSDNYIGFNHHFGVAIDAKALNVAMIGNSFQANHQAAIDWGLDGLSLTSPVVLPEIVDAHFENGQTVIEVKPGDVGGTFYARVQIYANDEPDPSGFGEGQYFLGEMSRDEQGRFILRFPDDLRGKWIAATNTRTVYNGWLRGPRTAGDSGWGLYTTTSEFGRAVQVR